MFAFRSLRLPGWKIGWLSNPLLHGGLAVTIGAQMLAVYWPPLQVLLRTVRIGASQWQWNAAFVLPSLIIPELVKSLPRKDQRA